jgi:hypothetical protein
VCNRRTPFLLGPLWGCWRRMVALSQRVRRSRSVGGCHRASYLRASTAPFLASSCGHRREPRRSRSVRVCSSVHWHDGWLVAVGCDSLLFCLVISCFAVTHGAAIAGALVALLFDGYTHYSVAMSKSSTAAIAYIYSPLWNTLVFAPAAILVAWLVRRRTRNA